jgi:acyl carrier protein
VQAGILTQLYEVFRQEWPAQTAAAGELGPRTAIFYEGIGLDSVDGVMLIFAIEEKFGLQLNQETLTPEAFACVDTLANFIGAQMQTDNV